MEYYRVLKRGGSCIIWYDLFKIQSLKDFLEAAGFKQIRFIEWLKTNPVPINSSATYLSNAREIAISCVKGGKATFNSKYDNGIYKYPIYSGKDRFHPTQKSLPLFEELIKKHSNEGDVVLDFCMGSGSTGVACKNLNRNFIGIEKDEEFYRMAQKRINETQVQTKLF